MASEGETSCIGDPNFAVVCSFLEKFGAQCGLSCPDFLTLQEMLENTEDLAPELLTIHLKLLRRINKSVSVERWEKVLTKITHRFSSQDAWEIERFGYRKSRTSSKVRILKHLMEMQFDYHLKFKSDLNKLTADELRSKPIGKDKNGHSYWYLIDELCQIRVYREDPDEETFVLVAKDREGLVKLIGQLSYGEAIKDLNEDSNSLEIEKPITDTGQISSSTSVLDESSNGQIKTSFDQKDESTSSKEDIKETVTKPPSEDSNSQSEKPEIEKEEIPKLKLTVKKFASDFSSLSEPPFEQGSIESALRLSGYQGTNSEVEDSEEIDEEEEEINLPKHMTRPRLDRPKLLSKSKKKSTSEEEEFDDEEISEPVMLIRGEGTGKDCNSGNTLIQEEEYGEAIEETVMFFYGEGNGLDCETGNHDKEEIQDSKSQKSECSTTKEKDLEDNNKTKDTPTDSSDQQNAQMDDVIDNCPKENVKNLISKFESVENEPVPKKPMFFFGPNSLGNPFIASSVTKTDSSQKEVPKNIDKSDLETKSIEISEPTSVEELPDSKEDESIKNKEITLSTTNLVESSKFTSLVDNKNLENNSLEDSLGLDLTKPTLEEEKSKTTDALLEDIEKLCAEETPEENQSTKKSEICPEVVKTIEKSNDDIKNLNLSSQSVVLDKLEDKKVPTKTTIEDASKNEENLSYIPEENLVASHSKIDEIIDLEKTAKNEGIDESSQNKEINSAIEIINLQNVESKKEDNIEIVEERPENDSPLKNPSKDDSPITYPEKEETQNNPILTKTEENNDGVQIISKEIPITEPAKAENPSLEVSQILHVKQDIVEKSLAQTTSEETKNEKNIDAIEETTVNADQYPSLEVTPITELVNDEKSQSKHAKENIEVKSDVQTISIEEKIEVIEEISVNEPLKDPSNEVSLNTEAKNEGTTPSLKSKEDIEEKSDVQTISEEARKEEKIKVIAEISVNDPLKDEENEPTQSIEGTATSSQPKEDNEKKSVAQTTSEEIKKGKNTGDETSVDESIQKLPQEITGITKPKKEDTAQSLQAKEDIEEKSAAKTNLREEKEAIEKTDEDGKLKNVEDTSATKNITTDIKKEQGAIEDKTKEETSTSNTRKNEENHTSSTIDTNLSKKGDKLTSSSTSKLESAYKNKSEPKKEEIVPKSPLLPKSHTEEISSSKITEPSTENQFENVDPRNLSEDILEKSQSSDDPLKKDCITEIATQSIKNVTKKENLVLEKAKIGPPTKIIDEIYNISEDTSKKVDPTAGLTKFVGYSKEPVVEALCIKATAYTVGQDLENEESTSLKSVPLKKEATPDEKTTPDDIVVENDESKTIEEKNSSNINIERLGVKSGKVDKDTLEELNISEVKEVQNEAKHATIVEKLDKIEKPTTEKDIPKLEGVNIIKKEIVHKSEENTSKNQQKENLEASVDKEDKIEEPSNEKEIIQNTKESKTSLDLKTETNIRKENKITDVKSMPQSATEDTAVHKKETIATPVSSKKIEDKCKSSTEILDKIDSKDVKKGSEKKGNLIPENKILDYKNQKESNIKSKSDKKESSVVEELIEKAKVEQNDKTEVQNPEETKHKAKSDKKDTPAIEETPQKVTVEQSGVTELPNKDENNCKSKSGKNDVPVVEESNQKVSIEQTETVVVPNKEEAHSKSKSDQKETHIVEKSAQKVNVEQTGTVEVPNKEEANSKSKSDKTETPFSEESAQKVSVQQTKVIDVPNKVEASSKSKFDKKETPLVEESAQKVSVEQTETLEVPNKGSDKSKSKSDNKETPVAEKCAQNISVEQIKTIEVPNKDEANSKSKSDKKETPLAEKSAQKISVEQIKTIVPNKDEAKSKSKSDMKETPIVEQSIQNFSVEQIKTVEVADNGESNSKSKSKKKEMAQKVSVEQNITLEVTNKGDTKSKSKSNKKETPLVEESAQKISVEPTKIIEVPNKDEAISKSKSDKKETPFAGESAQKVSVNQTKTIEVPNKDEANSKSKSDKKETHIVEESAQNVSVEQIKTVEDPDKGDANSKSKSDTKETALVKESAQKISVEQIKNVEVPNKGEASSKTKSDKTETPIVEVSAQKVNVEQTKIVEGPNKGEGNSKSKFDKKETPIVEELTQKVNKTKEIPNQEETNTVSVPDKQEISTQKITIEQGLVDVINKEETKSKSKSIKKVTLVKELTQKDSVEQKEIEVPNKERSKRRLKSDEIKTTQMVSLEQKEKVERLNKEETNIKSKSNKKETSLPEETDSLVQKDAIEVQSKEETTGKSKSVEKDSPAVEILSQKVTIKLNETEIVEKKEETKSKSKAGKKGTSVIEKSVEQNKPKEDQKKEESIGKSKSNKKVTPVIEESVKVSNKEETNIKSKSGKGGTPIVAKSNQKVIVEQNKVQNKEETKTRLRSSKKNTLVVEETTQKARVDQKETEEVQNNEKNKGKPKSNTKVIPAIAKTTKKQLKPKKKDNTSTDDESTGNIKTRGSKNEITLGAKESDLVDEIQISDSDGSIGFDNDAAEDFPSEEENNSVKELTPKEEEPVVKPITRPLLTVVDITKLQKKFDVDDIQPENKQFTEVIHHESVLSPIIILDNDSNDVIPTPETDPLACIDEEIKIHESEQPKTMTLLNFSLDVEEPEEESLLIPVRRSLRGREIRVVPTKPKPAKKRPREPEPEEKTDSNAKKRRTRGKPLHSELRKSIEEQKKKENISSDEEDNSEPKIVKKYVFPPKKKKKGFSKAKVKETIEIVDSPTGNSDAPSEVSKTDQIATPEKPKPKCKKSNRRLLLGLDIEEIQKEIEENTEPSGRNTRHSRRIAQQKIREEAEQIKEEKKTKPKKKKKGKEKEVKTIKADLKKKKGKVETDDDSDASEEDSKGSLKHKKKKKEDLKKLFNMTDAWKSSSGSSSQEDEEEEVEYEVSEEEVKEVLKSDHEFSPESDLEDNTEATPTRRARTVKKETASEEPDDEHACQKCSKSDHPELILLCDKCDCGWHCSCLRPALLDIPDGEWFCPPCQHISLIEALRGQLVEYDKRANRLEIEERRKERLAYVEISLDNVLPTKEHLKHKKEDGSEDESSSSSGSSDSGSSTEDSDEPIYQLRQRRQAHSYRFNDYDDLINSAIQDEVEAEKGAGNQGRGKDIATIVNAEKEDALQDAQTENTEGPLVVPLEKETEEEKAANPKSDKEESEEELRVVPKHTGKKKHRKLNSLDVNSEDEVDSDESFKGDSGSEEDFEEDVDSDEDSDEFMRSKRKGPTRRSTRARTTRYDREFIDDNSDEDDRPRKKKSRSMWDESESEESDKSWGRRGKSKKNRSEIISSSRSHKKSKKKKRKREDSDGEKPKKKRPRIVYGGLDDSDDELQTRRTRGKKITYVDPFGSDSEEEKKKPSKALESEDEYVNEDDEEDLDEVPEEEEQQEQPEQPVEEKEANSEESEEEKIPPVVPKKIINLPILEKVPKSPRARGRGRGFGGPQRPQHAPKLTSPPIIPTRSVTDHPLEDSDSTEKEDEEESLPPQKTEKPANIPNIADNPDDMDDEEAVQMMESEEYANKQLELMAIQIAKEKRRRELEALQKINIPPIPIPAEPPPIPTQPEEPQPKKRGRRKKFVEGTSPLKQQLQAKIVPPMIISKALITPPPVLNETDQEKPIIPQENIQVPTVVQDLSGSPPKRRGRGKGKKTLAAEAAAAGTPTDGGDSQTPPSSLPHTTENTNISTGSADSNPPTDTNFQTGKLAVATPPQPFSQSQPTPSVITRMLQSQPLQSQPFTTAANAMNQKYFGSMDQPRGPPPQFSNINPRGRVPSPYRPNIPPGGFPQQRPPLNPGSPHRLRSPGPQNMPMFHSPHHLDPSPSGGGHVMGNTPNRDRQSPLETKGGVTPPPAPQYNRPMTRFPGGGEVPGPSVRPHGMPFQSSPPRVPAGGFSPYHPPQAANFHYGAYPPPGALAAADDALPPTAYQTSSYPEQYNNPENVTQSSEGSNSKPFEEEGSGEFGGLVSYFSSQREDDLDT